MLILIVVAAAIALAAFVAGYESQYLAEQASAHDKALESLLFLSVVPAENSTPGADNYSAISAVIGSYDVMNTTISEVNLNGQPLAFFTVTPLGSSSSLQVCPLCPNGTVPGSVSQFNLAPDEQATIAFNLATWNAAHQDEGGMFSPFDLPLNHFITLGAYTTLGNDFTRSFLPPTAIATVSTLTTLNDGTFEDVPILDGSNSVPPVNGTISEWEWNVTNPVFLSSSSASLTSSTTVSSAAPNPESGTATFLVPPKFVGGSTLNLTIMYTPTTGPSGVGEVAPGSVAFTESAVMPGGEIDVTYTFSYIVSGATNAGTISIANDGASLNYTATSPYDTATSSTQTLNGAGTVTLGVNAETGSATFPEPYPFFGVTAVALKLQGTAIGSISSGPVITGQYVSAQVVTVNFAFNYTATTPGTLTIQPQGATLTYTTLLTYFATGEKVEPSYWTSAPSGTAFNVILTVVANDGLLAVAQLTYTTP
jgi:hypothetical protein